MNFLWFVLGTLLLLSTPTSSFGGATALGLNQTCGLMSEIPCLSHHDCWRQMCAFYQKGYSYTCIVFHTTDCK